MNWSEKRAIARMITKVENGEEGFEEALKDHFLQSGHAHVIGITGPPGAGKSSLTDQLAKAYLKDNKKVAIIAIDPTSPFTGGSILGDRIRMGDLSTNPNVFIRSMGTRGHLGGLSASTHLVKRILDAAGADVIFIETVGVGQSEVEIVKTADTVLMVMVPGLGDDIQGLKAGIMEIGDVFTVNKSDLPGADRTKIDIQNALSFLPHSDWMPSITMVSAREQTGIEELKEAIKEHYDYLSENDRLQARRKQNLKSELIDLLYDKLYKEIVLDESFEEALEEVILKKLDPYRAVEKLLQHLKEKE
ncbi:methylmalonyl Co-A mutase-associated GTPase MeaB [Guggenheimella bovis]